MGWRSTHFRTLLARCWEGEVFVFNPGTGHTHILNNPSWLILSACAGSTCGEAELLDLMAINSEATSEELQPALEAHLEHLQQLDLIQPTLANAAR